VVAAPAGISDRIGSALADVPIELADATANTNTAVMFVRISLPENHARSYSSIVFE
jgi:hypothetical protein